MTPTVNDIINIMASVAPLTMAESWDNCGLQVGSRDWSVKKVVIALDPLPEVVDYCCSVDADMLITHHPLIFKPIKTIDVSTTVGTIIQKAFANRLAIYSAHTNLDSVCGGINDLLASMIGLTDIRVLGKPFQPEKCKLVFYAPVEHKDNILGALSKTTAGIIGDYTCCSFLCPGNGTYRPGATSTPYKGVPGEITVTDEVRIETVALQRDVDSVVKAIRKVHPYETMAYDVFPLKSDDLSQGIGRVGTLKDNCLLSELADRVKTALGIKTVKVAGNQTLDVSTVAICTGSGSGLMTDFLKSGADVYISGDLHYHDARTAEELGKGLIDAGHFATEVIVADALMSILKLRCSENAYSLDIETCPVEKDPFYYL